jgi:hypothetical protein
MFCTPLATNGSFASATIVPATSYVRMVTLPSKDIVKRAATSDVEGFGTTDASKRAIG